MEAPLVAPFFWGSESWLLDSAAGLVEWGATEPGGLLLRSIWRESGGRVEGEWRESGGRVEGGWREGGRENKIERSDI